MAWLYTMMGEHQANCKAGFKGATSPFVGDWGVSPKEFLFLLPPQAARKRGGAVRKLPPSGTSPDEHHQKDVGKRWKRGRAR
jgi:hypothetical protein